MEISGLQNVASAGALSGANINQLWRTGLETQVAQGAEVAATGSFDSFLRAMLENVSETNNMIAGAQQMQLDVAMGYSDDLLGLTLAIDRAQSSLTFTVQVVNRLLESYREIMRMQV